MTPFRLLDCFRRMFLLAFCAVVFLPHSRGLRVLAAVDSVVPSVLVDHSQDELRLDPPTTADLHAEYKGPRVVTDEYRTTLFHAELGHLAGVACEAEIVSEEVVATSEDAMEVAKRQIPAFVSALAEQHLSDSGHRGPSDAESPAPRGPLLDEPPSYHAHGPPPPADVLLRRPASKVAAFAGRGRSSSWTAGIVEAGSSPSCSMRLLGKGGFGEVYECGGYAVKVLRSTEKDLRKTLREVAVLKELTAQYESSGMGEAVPFTKYQGHTVNRLLWADEPVSCRSRADSFASTRVPSDVARGVVTGRSSLLSSPPASPAVGGLCSPTNIMMAAVANTVNIVPQSGGGGGSSFPFDGPVGPRARAASSTTASPSLGPSMMSPGGLGGASFFVHPDPKIAGAGSPGSHFAFPAGRQTSPESESPGNDPFGVRGHESSEDVSPEELPPAHEMPFASTRSWNTGHADTLLGEHQTGEHQTGEHWLEHQTGERAGTRSGLGMLHPLPMQISEEPGTSLSSVSQIDRPAVQSPRPEDSSLLVSSVSSVSPRFRRAPASKVFSEEDSLEMLGHAVFSDGDVGWGGTSESGSSGDLSTSSHSNNSSTGHIVFADSSHSLGGSSGGVVFLAEEEPAPAADPPLVAAESSAEVAARPEHDQEYPPISPVADMIDSPVAILQGLHKASSVEPSDHEATGPEIPEPEVAADLVDLLGGLHLVDRVTGEKVFSMNAKNLRSGAPKAKRRPQTLNLASLISDSSTSPSPPPPALLGTVRSPAQHTLPGMSPGAPAKKPPRSPVLQHAGAGGPVIPPGRSPAGSPSGSPGLPPKSPGFAPLRSPGARSATGGCRLPHLGSQMSRWGTNRTSYSRGRENRQFFVLLAMDLLPVGALNLKDWVADKDRTMAEKTAVALSLLDNIAAVHRAGFLHLDLSLANVMVVEDTIPIAIAPAGASSSNDAGMLKKPAKKPRTVLIDFGLSDVVDAENGLSKISHGTPGSVPPEGHTTLSDVSERFSLGVVLLQMRNYVQANAGTRMELVRLYESARDLANLRAVDATDLAKNSEANEEKLREIVLTGLRASILLEKESPKNLPPRINQLLEKEFELYLRSLSPREEVRPGVSEWRSHFEAWRAELEQ